MVELPFPAPVLGLAGDSVQRAPRAVARACSAVTPEAIVEAIEQAAHESNMAVALGDVEPLLIVHQDFT